MGISVSIPGLDEFVDKIPNGNLILVEGSIDPITSIFVQKLATISSKNDRKVTYITSKAKEEVTEQISYFQDEQVDFRIVEERSTRHWKDYIEKNSVIIIDSFSYLIIDRQLIEVRNILEEFLKLCKQLEAIVLITIEKGMLDEKIEVTCLHLADGIFNFLSKETQLGVMRYIRIPKWINGKAFDKNIYYNFDGKRINVDLRARVR
jgi:archaellum biogenesis ATPase FlaH